MLRCVQSGWARRWHRLQPVRVQREQDASDTRAKRGHNAKNNARITRNNAERWHRLQPVRAAYAFYFRNLLPDRERNSKNYHPLLVNSQSHISRSWVGQDGGTARRSRKQTEGGLEPARGFSLARRRDSSPARTEVCPPKWSRPQRFSALVAQALACESPGRKAGDLHVMTRYRPDHGNRHSPHSHVRIGVV
jgi:hypothetical protein